MSYDRYDYELEWLEEGRRICRSGLRSSLFGVLFNLIMIAIHFSQLLMGPIGSYILVAIHLAMLLYAASMVPGGVTKIARYDRDIEIAILNEMVKEGRDEERDTMTIKATRLGSVNPGSVAQQIHWRLSEPVGYGYEFDSLGVPKAMAITVFVVTSASLVFGTPETFIFPADDEGNILDWGEMDGSYRGGLNHERAILGAGWSIPGWRL